MNRIIIILLVIFFSSSAFSDVRFKKLNGTDLGMGTGSPALGMSGAFTAIADDASAIFWNPAGLTQIEKNEAMLSGYLPDGFSAAAIIFSLPKRFMRKMDITVGFGVVNRLSIDGDSGSDSKWDGYPLQILDLSMIELGEGFSGSLDSKTIDKRFSFSVSPFFVKNLSLGVNIVSIE